MAIGRKTKKGLSQFCDIALKIIFLVFLYILIRCLFVDLFVCLFVDLFVDPFLRRHSEYKLLQERPNRLSVDCNYQYQKQIETVNPRLLPP